MPSRRSNPKPATAAAAKGDLEALSEEQFDRAMEVFGFDTGPASAPATVTAGRKQRRNNGGGGSDSSHPA